MLVKEEQESEAELDQEQTPTQLKQRFPWLRIAAAIILTAGLAWAGFRMIQSETPIVQEMITASENVVKDTLPDGSMVTLNRHASISYPSRFTGNNRPVKLTGEAFFNVQADKKKPFVIAVNDIEVTVVGTSFNIRSKGDSTEVVVETGIVRVARGGNTIELKAGERITIPANTIELKKEVVTDKLYNYYSSRVFECEDTPLWKLVAVLNEAYDANIIIANDALKAEPINSTYVNQPLDNILELIKGTITTKTMTITKKGNQIILE